MNTTSRQTRLAREERRLARQDAYFEGCHGKAEKQEYMPDDMPVRGAWNGSDVYPEAAFGGDGPWNGGGGEPDAYDGEAITQASYVMEQASTRAQGCLAGTNHFWF
jgi:hypothetical protein